MTNNETSTLSELVKKINKIGVKIPIINRLYVYKTKEWIKNEYTPFARNSRKYLYMSCARFLNINRPIPGYSISNLAVMKQIP